MKMKVRGVSRIKAQMPKDLEFEGGERYFTLDFK